MYAFKHRIEYHLIVWLTPPLSVAGVWFQKYTSGLSSAAHCQRQETKHPKSDRCLCQLQAPERMSLSERPEDQIFFLLDMEEQFG